MSAAKIQDLLRAKLDTEAVSASESWKAEVGDELFGVFKGWTRGTTRSGDSFPIANIQRGDRTVVAVWAFYKVLTEELKKAQLKSGDPVMIKRYEDQKSRMGQPYRVYRVATLEEQNPFDGVSAPLDQDWLEAEGGAA
jgi:co-chaperonin GroES (HSP10)